MQANKVRRPLNSPLFHIFFLLSFCSASVSDHHKGRENIQGFLCILNKYTLASRIISEFSFKRILKEMRDFGTCSDTIIYLGE